MRQAGYIPSGTLIYDQLWLRGGIRTNVQDTLKLNFQLHQHLSLAEVTISKLMLFFLSFLMEGNIK